MKKRIITAIIAVVILVSIVPSANAVSLLVDNTAITSNVTLYNSTTYVPIRAVSQMLSPGAKVTWENGQAVVRTTSQTLTARPGDCYMQANGRFLYASEGIRLVNGTTLVPIRVLAKALGATVTWNGSAQTAVVKRGSGTIASGDSYYGSDAVYWLSRIINAESSGEPLKGKIAVGNVILNRVSSSSFPNSIYGVIFDTKYGTQFQPVANGTIYNTPSAECVLAAKLCLDNASVVGASLFFFNASKATSYWIAQSCTYVATIGNHQFYA